MEQRPEIANSVLTGSFHTNYHDIGSGFPLIMLHGSGPGVSAWANWNKVFPLLSAEHHVYALDLVGFGYTDRPAGMVYQMDAWIKQVIDFMDALGIEKAVCHQNADVLAAGVGVGPGGGLVAHLLSGGNDLGTHLGAYALLPCQTLGNGNGADAQPLCNVRHAYCFCHVPDQLSS